MFGDRVFSFWMKKDKCYLCSLKNWQKLLKNYYPILLLPTWRKTLSVHSSVYKFFRENNLISPNQSGFETGDWGVLISYTLLHMNCANQLMIAIKWEQYFLTCLNPPARFGILVFITNWIRNRVAGNLLKTLTDFLGNRKQRIIINAQY